jgi:hypothetical protein
MTRPLFRPSLQQCVWLAAITLTVLTYALYLRHLVIEQSAVGIACQSGTQSWLCSSRRIAIALFTPSVFGIVALGAALLNLARPTFILCAIALVAAGFGIVLYNVALSALAIALLIVSLARPAPEPE